MLGEWKIFRTAAIRVCDSDCTPWSSAQAASSPAESHMVEVEAVEQVVAAPRTDSLRGHSGNIIPGRSCRLISLGDAALVLRSHSAG